MRMWQLAAGYFSFFFSLHWLHLVPKRAQVDHELGKKKNNNKRKMRDCRKVDESCMEETKPDAEQHRGREEVLTS